MSPAHEIRCDDCGIDLSLNEFQIAYVRKYGNPLPRPPCPARMNGAHRVSKQQLWRVIAASAQSPAEVER